MLPQMLDRGEHRRRAQRLRMVEGARAVWSSTIPYYIYKLQLMARTDDDSIRSWDDLRAQPGQTAQARRRACETRPPSVTSTASSATSVDAQEVSGNHQRDGPGRARPARCNRAGRARRRVLRPRFSRVFTMSASRKRRVTTSPTSARATIVCDGSSTRRSKRRSTTARSNALRKIRRLERRSEPARGSRAELAARRRGRTVALDQLSALHRGCCCWPLG